MDWWWLQGLNEGIYFLSPDLINGLMFQHRYTCQQLKAMFHLRWSAHFMHFWSSVILSVGMSLLSRHWRISRMRWPVSTTIVKFSKVVSFQWWQPSLYLGSMLPSTIQSWFTFLVLPMDSVPQSPNANISKPLKNRIDDPTSTMWLVRCFWQTNALIS